MIVFVTDLTDFPASIYKFLSRILTKGVIVSGNGKLHLISCSLCQMHWVGLLYIILTGNFSIPMWGYVCLLAFLTGPAKDGLYLLKDLITKLINIVYKLV